MNRESRSEFFQGAAAASLLKLKVKKRTLITSSGHLKMCHRWLYSAAIIVMVYNLVYDYGTSQGIRMF